MRKFKYMLLGISFLIMLPFFYISSNIDQVLNANTDNNDNGVQFDLYDEIIENNKLKYIVHIKTSVK